MPTTSEVSTRLSADNSNFRTVFRQSEDVAEKTGKAILKKIDLRAGVGAIAAAIGFNMQSIAEGIARLYTGMSKDAEQALEELVAATGKAADAQERLLEAARQRREKSEQQSREAVEKSYEVVRQARIDTYEDARKAAAEEEKRISELGFAEDLEWVKEQDRIAAKKKLELARIEEVKAAELAANEEAARVEQARIDEKFKSLIDQWKGFIGIVTSTGRGDRELSDRELQRKVANIQQDIFQRQVASPGQADFFLNPQRSNLAQTQAELNLRRDVRQRASAFGEERAFQQFPGLTEQRFSEILRGFDNSSAGRVAKELESLNKTLKQGIPTVLFSQPSG